MPSSARASPKRPARDSRATPHFAADYSFDHMALSPQLRRNISVTYYEAGHMMYVHRPSLEKLAVQLRKFVAADEPDR